MKLKTFISNECCNLVSQSCIGVDFKGRRFNKEGNCFVIDDEPKGCDFFRNCVLPIAHHRGCYNEVAGDYSFIDKKLKKDKARFCECGNKLEKSERLCKKCTNLKKKRKNK
jgi:hypothetical protein